MPIEVKASGGPRVVASVGETRIDVAVGSATTIDASVGGGIGPTGPAGTTQWSGIENKPELVLASEVPGLLSRANHTGTQAISTVTGLQDALDGKQPVGSYATLVGNKIPASQLPSYVDDVIEVATFASLPYPGETGKIYVVIQTNKVYRWTGFVWLEIVASPGSTDAIAEGNVNLYFTNARAAAASPVQSVAGRTGAVVLGGGDIVSGTISSDRLPTASANSRGTVRIGSGVSIDNDGVISVSIPSLDWSSITNKPSFAAVATSGSYNDLTNKPSLFDGAYSSLSGVPSTFTPSAHTHVLADITDAGTAAGSDVADFAAASDFDQGVKTTDSPSFDSVGFLLSVSSTDGSPDRDPDGPRYSHVELTRERLLFSLADWDPDSESGYGGTLEIGWSGITFSDNTVQDTAFIPENVAAALHAHSAADVNSGTLADARLSNNAQAAINLYLWSSFR